MFLATSQLFRLLAPPRARYEHRDRVLASYAPISLIATLAAWLALTMAGFVLIFMGVDGLGWSRALELSGSSLFTLGFRRPEGIESTLLVFTEAAIGLFLLALLITYLPSIYSAFGRRELGGTALEVRAGAPPSAREMVSRYFRLERAHLLGEVWEEWERWFVDVEESHTSLPALVFLPVAAARSRLGDCRGGRAGRGIARPLERRHPARRPGGLLHPRRLPVPPTDR